MILALDIGTSSTRTALFNDEAQRIAGTTAQQSYPLLTSADGGAELEPAALLGAVKKCIEQTMRAHRTDASLRGRRIEGVGVSCFWHSLVGVNSKRDTITRIITWADARCRGDAAKLRDTLKEKEIHARTGCMVRASFWPAKLAWLRRVERPLFGRVKEWMSPAEWLQFKLCGEAHCAVGMATGTGLFNPAKLAWETDLLRRFDLKPDMLCPVTDDPVPVAGELAAQFPELKNVPWFPGIGDGAASNLGSGATRPGLAAVNVGTSAALRVMKSSGPVRAPFGLFCYRVDAARFVVGGAVSNAGNLRAWCMRELKLADDSAAVERAMAARPEPAHGLVVLPFWNAERAPTWDEDKRGAITGITQHTTALDILQATTEASFHRIARIAELVLANEKAAPKFIVSGGIQKSPSGLQRLANVLGQPIYPNDEPEASLRGGAIFAMEKLGMAVPEARLKNPIRPQQKIAKLYAVEREKQRHLESLL